MEELVGFLTIEEMEEEADKIIKNAEEKMRKKGQ